MVVCIFILCRECGMISALTCKYPLSVKVRAKLQYSQTCQCYVITGPISEDLSEEADLVQTRKLTECHSGFEDQLEPNHRYDTLFLFDYFHVVINTARRLAC